MAEKVSRDTAADYINILESLIREWKVEEMRQLTEAGKKALDYIMRLPSRLMRVAERINS